MKLNKNKLALIEKLNQLTYRDEGTGYREAKVYQSLIGDRSENSVAILNQEHYTNLVVSGRIIRDRTISVNKAWRVMWIGIIYSNGRLCLSYNPGVSKQDIKRIIKTATKRINAIPESQLIEWIKEVENGNED